MNVEHVGYLTPKHHDDHSYHNAGDDRDRHGRRLARAWSLVLTAICDGSGYIADMFGRATYKLTWEEIVALLNPAAENVLQKWPVSKRVNSASVDFHLLREV